jgi:TPR repeat protein
VALRPVIGMIVLTAAVAAAWTWPPSARVLHGGLENNLGFLYLHGIVVDKDPRQAIAWYTRAAQRGLATAEYNLGYLYQAGGDHGIAPNPREAVRWYELAAAQNHPEACNNLAMMYTDGSLGVRDLPRARAWLKRAKAVASQESAAVLAGNLEALEHDMSPDQLARSDALLPTLPRKR